MIIDIPEFCLIILIGPSGSGKSTFAKKYFKNSEIVSSDHCRYLLTDDESCQKASADAFELLYHITNIRLANRKLTVIDATNLNAQDRSKLHLIAKRNNCQTCAIVFDLPSEVCKFRNQQRLTRIVPEEVINQQLIRMQNMMNTLKNEKYVKTFVFHSEDEINHAAINRTKLTIDKNDEMGPFDIIGDIHGCYDELKELLTKLDYNINENLIYSDELAITSARHRRVIFLGDLIDRGPNSIAVLALVMNMVKHGIAFCILGNHDLKFLSYLKGKNIQIKHGLETTIKEFETVSEAFKNQVILFLESLDPYYILDNNKLVAAHAGLKERYQGRISQRIKSFALYGDTTDETDELGFPIRQNWAQHYKGEAMVVYGHTLISEAVWINNTLCIDTGCVFGGKLTALRYPEKEIVEVVAKAAYY
jgi:protein phosphatase